MREREREREREKRRRTKGGNSQSHFQIGCKKEKGGKTFTFHRSLSFCPTLLSFCNTTSDFIASES